MSAYLLSILEGFVVTVEVSIASLLLSVLLGLLCAAAKLSPYKILNWIGGAYTTVIRSIPDLIWMLLLYYGGQIAINGLFESLGFKTAPQISPFFAGVVIIGFVYGSFMAETFRGAILSVPKGQSEAGWAFGLSKFYTFRRIVLPQMVRFALPGFTNNWLTLIKSTALLSVIGLVDVTTAARQSSAAARGDVPGAALLFMAIAATLYLVITSVSLEILRRTNEKYSVGVKRGEF